VLEIATRDVYDGQLRYGDPGERLSEIDRTRAYPLTGPIFVEGARPGDVLAIEMLDVQAGAWGWTAILPGRGLLPDDFPNAYVRYSTMHEGQVEFLPGLALSVAPFLGTIGVAPDRPGPIPVRPPHEGGGNIDTRQLGRGSTLFLPVLAEGGLLSMGDGHAVQGDGEVCLTAVECELRAEVRLSIVRDHSVRPHTYEFTTSDASHPANGARSFGSSASGPDLRENARNAIRGLISWLEREHHLSAEDAYLLCSLAAELRISQLVNDPNSCVTALMPLSIFQ
jgi:acetamidase/formamidase